MSAAPLVTQSITREARPRRSPTPLVGAVSGKGGVGKTNLMANLAVAAGGLGARVLLVDGDLGLANVDVLLGLVPPRSVADVLSGECELERVLVQGPRGVQVLPAASARQDLARAGERALRPLIRLIQARAADFDLVLIDAGAGIGPAVLGLASVCDPVLLITNAEPTSLADAYAILKVLHRDASGGRVELVVNSARDEACARRTHGQLDRISQRFLGRALGLRGFLPLDPRLADAVSQQRAVVDAYPGAPVSRQLVAMAAGLLRPRRVPAR
jgi:flagellar biosynthesis protein FlhG